MNESLGKMNSRTSFGFRTMAVLIFTFLSPLAFSQEEVRKEDEGVRMTAKTFQGLELRAIGPALMSGRIADIAVHPRDQSTWYVAAGSGGIFKTHNAGTTWTPIFKDQASYSIGCITLDPNDPEVVWVGTGENVGGRHVGFGDGVYRSLDGGKTWSCMGLKGTEHIGRIVVHPKDSQTIFVAAQGPLWSSGGERGLYRSQDGGQSWELVLGLGETTGVNDVLFDPFDPSILYASTHQHLRTVAALMNGGPESGIYKSQDGGSVWRELNSGLPDQDMGRIGLAVSPHREGVVYATIELGERKGGFFRSEDHGETWIKKSDTIAGGTGPHYYQELYPCPHQFDRVYYSDVRLKVTEDGGATFREVGEEYKHGDNHALSFDPKDPNYLLNGCDGGVYESWDRGKNWKFITNLPLTQFYKVAVDNDSPFYNVYGGTQDNNTQGGPSRTDNINGIRSSDWFITLFADGHQPAVDPENPDIVYSEWQQGNLVRYDRATGEIVYIQPQPEPGDSPERWNWDSPILISPHHPNRLYFASQRVWRSDNRGDSWEPISQDLSRGIDRLRTPIMGRLWNEKALWDLGAMSNFGTLTSLSESPLQEGLLYAGSDDGLLHRSEDGGETWVRCGPIEGLPEFAFVNDIKADLHDRDTVYVALDNHKEGDFSPYLFMSRDRGQTWTSLSESLPHPLLLWRIVQDHVDEKLLFLGTEFGVWFSLDRGQHWIELTGNVPTIPFRDLAIQRRENDLVGATFGRGFYILDDYSALRNLDEEALAQEALLFDVKDAHWYVPKRPLGRGSKATQGADFFVAPNPPFGAIFTYYLADGLKTKADRRAKSDQKRIEQGQGTPMPSFDELREESLEWSPRIWLTVLDEENRPLRQIEGDASPGFHRVAWDLRDRSYRPANDRGEAPEGVMLPPGNYRVRLSKEIDGEWTDLGQEKTFAVVPLSIQPTLPRQDIESSVAWLQDVDVMRGRVDSMLLDLNRRQNDIDAIKEALETAPHPELRGATKGLALGLREFRERIEGPQLQDRIGEPTRPGIARRLDVVSYGNRMSTYGPTPTHRRSFEIAAENFAALERDFQEWNSRFESHVSALEGAQIRWRRRP